ncbi:MAG TPA: 3-carboxy-cis,cis-muconate cycloisomerase [Micromonosporaceae bacterium]|nr:3-carboxy-cis,cis-muconate cycloisomerase [Micromonosporaceae bacterium]
MRPSSSRSDPADGPGLFDEVLARGPLRTAVSDAAWLRALLDVEAALARAQAAIGVIPPAAAAAVVEACRPERYPISALGRAAAGSGNPVLPLVHAIRAALPAELADSVHKGATSQDILDTAAMLIAHRATGPLLADLDVAAGAAARLARTHRDTAMAGRTLLQQAEPTTFGLKAAGWLVALDEAIDRIVEVRRSRLAVQLGGAAGTLAGYGESALELPPRVAAELGLAEPLLPWHTDRTRVAELAGALGTTCGVLGKIARDITLLAQSEVGEVVEGNPGESSAMPHKRNPVAAVSALACAAQAPGLVGTVLTAMVQEHERAAGGWHAEWRPMRELLVATGSAAAWLRDCLAGLVVNEPALAANLAQLHELTGRRGSPGAAGALVDRALAAHDSRTERRVR